MFLLFPWWFLLPFGRQKHRPQCIEKVDINCIIKILPAAWSILRARLQLLPSIHRHESQDVCEARGLCLIFKVKEGKDDSLQYSTLSCGSFYLDAVIRGDINSLWLVEPADVLLIQRHCLPFPLSCSSWTIYCPFTAKSQFHDASH